MDAGINEAIAGAAREAMTNVRTLRESARNGWILEYRVMMTAVSTACAALPRN
jgi:hypothetical protein